MKKRSKLMMAITTVFALVLTLTACGGFKKDSAVKKYSRDTASGTREGFFEKIDYKAAQKDDTKIPGAVIVASNGAMLESIAGDEYGIGYVSLASVAGNKKVKALEFDGVKPTEANVLSGDYKLTRNFNYIRRTDDDMSDTEKVLVKGFLLYMNSKEGLAIVKSKDGIVSSEKLSAAKNWSVIVEEAANADVKAACQNTTKTTIFLGGSTSVQGIATKLTEAFANVCSSFTANHNHTGSGDAYKRTQGSQKDDQNKLHIGFLSRDIKLGTEANPGDEPAAKNTYGTICIDGIAIIVNKANPITGITKANAKTVYSTENIKWSDVK